MTNQPPSLADIFAEYTRLRRSGRMVDEAAQTLKPLVEKLSMTDRQTLARLVQTWEVNEGKNLRPAAPPPSNPAANLATPTTINTYETQPKPPQGFHPTAPASPRRAENSVECPNCGKPNLKNDTYCYACGHILTLGTTPDTRNLESNIDPHTRWGTAHFGQFSSLLLMLRGIPQPIEVSPKVETTLGRRDPADSNIRVDIDFGPYNAEELGVSRIHAVLQRQENTVSIVDQNSKNGTFINGQKLYPSEVRVIRDGDEIRLGRLTMKINFRRQIRRLDER